ncbi:MAG: SDR family NAD(P)-dependent oxidoreductase [Allosphingosinicella sp.]
MNAHTFHMTPDPMAEGRLGRRLEGRTAIVTGAGSGIGRGIALLFAREGANVVVADLSIRACGETVASIQAEGGRAFFVEGDVRSPEHHATLVAAARAGYGRLDIAVNNAGISLAPTPAAQVPLGTWDEVTDVNLSGVFYAARAQIPAMLEAGGGAMVNIASAAGVRGVPGLSPYVASKHGLIGLTRTIAVEYAGQGIRANAIAPGFIDTPLGNHFSPEERARLASRHPMNRLGRVEEVAELALFLASSRSSFITGACVPIDGGILAQ